MSRDIKHRAWDKKKLILRPWEDIRTNNCPHFWDDDDFEIMEFTGLLDRNGKEIYERDILQVKTGWYKAKRQANEDIFDKSIKGDTYWSVEYKIFNSSMGFMVYGIDRRFSMPLTKSRLVNSEAVIVGNIYENPELLKQN